MAHSYEQVDWFKYILKKYGGLGDCLHKYKKGLYCSSVHAMLNQAAVNDLKGESLPLAVNDLKGESLPLDFNLQDVTDTIEV